MKEASAREDLLRGAVIVPAFNEASVITRTLLPLAPIAVDGLIELIVVCNGCKDDTAEIARSVAGTRVIELEQGSKPAALNAGDDAASCWPRLYLDADIQITAEAVLAVLDRLSLGDVLAARPSSRYYCADASALVRSYYRARQRIPQNQQAMWGAGAYGLSAEGHRRFGAFPKVTGDDLFVDAQFGADEKVVVATEPAVVKTPANVKSLLAIMRRSRRTTAELAADAGTGRQKPRQSQGLGTATSVLGGIRGPRSAVDAAVYVGMALAKRLTRGGTQVWERDESSRTGG